MASPPASRPHLALFATILASLLVSTGGVSLSPITSLLFGPFCGLVILIRLAADDVRTGEVSHAGLTMATGIAVIGGPLGAIATLIVR